MPPSTRADDERSAATRAAVDAFNDAFNRHDVEAVMRCMTGDAVFESTSPPAGERFEGAAAVRGAWEAFFAESPDAHFEGEDVIVAGDRCVVRWVYTWTDADGREGSTHGVDVLRVRDGLVCEKLASVKG